MQVAHQLNGKTHTVVQYGPENFQKITNKQTYITYGGYVPHKSERDELPVIKTVTEEQFMDACREAHAQPSGQDMSRTLLYRDQQRAAQNVTYREV